MTRHEDDEFQAAPPPAPVELGTVRMVVDKVERSRSQRGRIDAYCVAVPQDAPYVHVVITMRQPLPYHEGDEFDITFGPTRP